MFQTQVEEFIPWKTVIDLFLIYNNMELTLFFVEKRARDKAKENNIICVVFWLL